MGGFGDIEQIDQAIATALEGRIRKQVFNNDTEDDASDEETAVVDVVLHPM